MNLKNLKLPASSYNWTSIIGATIALISLFMIVFLFVITSIFNQGGSYIGIVIYIALPALLVIGLVLIPIGMVIKYKKIKKEVEKKELRWPSIDFNDPKHRNAFMIFSVGSTIFLLLSAIGSYEAFHYTESVEFCGTLCHEVMKPEYIAYQNSPHARVACVECHVGKGADWYVRSKLSGLYQVYSVTFNKYPRPIEVPIRNLRPARETCEECHWPEKFYARELRIERHYMSNSENTEWDIHLQMKTGPSLSALGLQEGIHWHINPDIKVEYVSTTNDREIIPWVRYTNLKTGEVHEYMDASNPLEEGQMDTLELRTLDCMDCHNRPSHNYHTPIVAVNDAITAGKIPLELPEIKFQAMQLVNATYSTNDSAMMAIEKGIKEYYSMAYEELYNSKPELFTRAIAGIQEAYQKNFFPEMKVKWSAYPNHIGHLEFNGCFRCHNNNHSTEDGRTIPMDCNLCHSIVAQGTPDSMQVIKGLDESLEFFHMDDPDGNWKDGLCSDCHRDLY